MPAVATQDLGVWGCSGRECWSISGSAIVVTSVRVEHRNLNPSEITLSTSAPSDA